MLAPGLVVVVAVLATTSAYPNGAPKLPMNLAMDSMCTSGNMRPHHKEHNRLIMPQSGPSPFTLRAESATYSPGIAVRVTLSADPGKNFKGFFITGDGEDAKTGFTGRFESLDNNARLSQFCSGGISHTNSNNKTQVTVLWNPPANYTHGTVQFKATVVENFRTFYTGILSNPVETTSSLDKQSVYAQKQVQRMMGGNGGVGGMMGGLNFGDMMKQMQSMMPNMPNMPNLRRPQRGPMSGNMDMSSLGLNAGQGGGMPNIGNLFRQMQG